uniref:Follicle-stimulating hormone beta subunit n=1 Tax=Mugil cephalus TaxID=48193 RepID=A0A2Z4EJU8_MUGCE|nr:follicle-stimulating hormone beta subunit [Mugil cephalus]
MQLVVMAAALAVAGAWQWQSCGFSGCRPTNTSITVESCGIQERIYTTACEGNCHYRDFSFIGDDETKQKVCNGDWSYEVKYIKGCPVGVAYPVATNCYCDTCDEDKTYCEGFSTEKPSCLPY